MTDHKAYWSRLEEAARAEAGFNGAAKPNVRAILDRILDAAAPIPAGIAYAAAADRALEVAADEMERLFPPSPAVVSFSPTRTAAPMMCPSFPG